MASTASIWASSSASMAASIPWGEVGVAFVIARADVDAAQLQAHCRELLANYNIPKRFVIEPDLPRLPVGKVDKMALRRLAVED